MKDIIDEVFAQAKAAGELCSTEQGVYGLYGVDIPKGVWHKIESMESGSVIFECKSGPFVPHEVDGILDLKK